MQTPRKSAFKEAEIGSKGNLPSLYAILKVYPPPTCTSPMHLIPTNLQALTTIFTQAFKKAKNKHSKSQKTGYEEIAVGVVLVLVALFSGNKKRKK